MRFTAALALAAACATSAWCADAKACTPPPPAEVRALPSPDEEGVSTATSLVILAPRQPSWLVLLAGGSEIPTDGVEMIGSGYDGTSSRPTSFWRVRGVGELPPMAEIVLSGVVEGERVELTRFHTGPGYDKQPGTPARIHSLRLTRVQYPVSAIATGSCIFAEWHTWVELDYDLASLPDTPPEAMVYVLSLRPRTGGTTHTFVTTGPRPYTGFAPSPYGLGPSPGSWNPDIDPSGDYCLVIDAFGHGDLARLVLRSDEICVTVEARPLASAGGGCSMSGRMGSMLLALMATAWLVARRSLRPRQYPLPTNMNGRRPSSR